MTRLRVALGWHATDGDVVSNVLRPAITALKKPRSGEWMAENAAGGDNHVNTTSDRGEQVRTFGVLHGDADVFVADHASDDAGVILHNGYSRNALGPQDKEPRTRTRTQEHSSDLSTTRDSTARRSPRTCSRMREKAWYAVSLMVVVMRAPDAGASRPRSRTVKSSAVPSNCGHTVTCAVGEHALSTTATLFQHDGKQGSERTSMLSPRRRTREDCVMMFDT